MDIKITIHSPSRLATRVGLVLGIPLALLLGPRAMAWADLQIKTWTAGDKLTAADLNAEFAKVKGEFASTKRQIKIGDAGTIANIAFTTTNGPPLVPAEPIVTFTVTEPGMYRISGHIRTACLNKIAGDRETSVSIDPRILPDGVDKNAIKVAALDDTIHQSGPGNTQQLISFAYLRPEYYANLSPGQYTFGITASGSCDIESGGIYPGYSRLIAERVNP